MKYLVYASWTDSNDDENDCEKDFDEDLDIEEAYINGQHEIRQNKDKNLVERDEEEVDVEEAFINGKHRILVDPEYEYEEERRLNKQVKDRLSQLGLCDVGFGFYRLGVCRDGPTNKTSLISLKPFSNNILK